MLRSVYPEHKWLPWKFKRLPRQIGRDDDAMKEALSYIEIERNIRSPEDWYRVSHRNLIDLGVAPMIHLGGGLFEVLRKYKADFKWEEDKFFRGK